VERLKVSLKQEAPTSIGGRGDHQSLVSVNNRFIKENKNKFFEVIRNFKNVKLSSLRELGFLISILIRTIGKVPEYFYHPNDVNYSTL
jgi:hypothetical protein